MLALNSFWRKLTHTKALETSSGRLEIEFFETIYRVTYLTGFSSADDAFPYLVYSSAVKLLIILLFCAEFWYALTATSSIDEIAASINTITIQLISVYRYGKMIIHKDVYRKLARSMQSPHFDISTVQRRNLVNYWAQKNENYLKLLLFLGNCSLVPWFLYPLIDELDYNMFIAIRLPFNYDSPMAYALTYLGLVMVFMYMSHFVMGNDLLMQAHLLHLVCQFTVLSDCFENILKDCALDFKDQDWNVLVTNDRFREVYKKRLGDMVYQHQNILDHVMDLRRTLSGPMLGQLAGSGLLICFLGFQATTTGADDVTKCLMSLLFLSYNLFEFYIICRWCEEITVQSQRVGEAAYCSNWEFGLTDLKGVKSSLVLVIARANKPLILTAGGMYNLSLLSYTTLVKTSYSALTVLLRFRQN
uniref:Odorant receptor n=1 Tax=Cnaphalocrocis medinalis TaxID=437488 RepID=A0A1B2G2N3_CNAME|nr:olfactory receptor 39 [Cnaphalocrocis medinalis]